MIRLYLPPLQLPRLALRAVRLSAILTMVVQTLPASGQTYLWNNSAAGSTYDWNVSSNWNPATVPNAAGAVANMGADITGAQTIRLRQNITLGSLLLGDGGSGTDSAMNVTNLSPETFTLTVNAGAGANGLIQSIGASNTIGGTTSGTEINLSLSGNTTLLNGGNSSTSLRVSGVVTTAASSKLTIIGQNGTSTNLYGTSTTASTGGIGGSGAVSWYGSGTLSFASASGGSSQGANNTFTGAFNATGGSVNLSSDRSAMTGASSFTLNDASLSLGPMVSASNKIKNGSPVALNGASLSFSSITADRSESLGNLTVGAGQTSFTMSGSAIFDAILAFGTTQRSAGGTVLFTTAGSQEWGNSAGATGRVTTSSAASTLNQNGITPWAVVRPNVAAGGFATYDSTSVGGFAVGYDEYAAYTSGPIANTPTANYKVTGTGATENLAANAQINSLLIDTQGGSYTLADGAGTSLTVGTSGTPTTTYSPILSRGNLTTPATATAASIDISNLILSGEGIIFTEGANHTLTINSAITGNAGLSKNLAGTLILNADNTALTGALFVNAGKLALGSSGAVPNVSSIRVARGATFDISAKPGFTLSSSQTLSGRGTIAGAIGTDGIVHPGGNGGIGTLTFTENLTLGSTSSSTLEFTTATLALESFDLLKQSVTGKTILFDGSLVLTFDPAEDYVNGSIAKIFDFSIYSGTFDTVSFTGLDVNQTATFNPSTGEITIAAVPELTTGRVFLLGIGLLFAIRRRRVIL